MSHGPGIPQRRILDALTTRGARERYTVVDEEVEELVGRWEGLKVVRARWRWYTIDLLGIANSHTPRSSRVSLHRAIRTLGKVGLVQVAGQLPYQQPFAAYVNYNNDLMGGVDLCELTDVDDRWPSVPNRALWFRLPAPHPTRAVIPGDDQLAILDLIETYRPDPFEDFAATLDHHGRWTSPVGRFLAWIFCGTPEEPGYDS